MKGNTVNFQRTAYHLELPSETILEVEVVEELTGEVHTYVHYKLLFAFLLGLSDYYYNRVLAIINFREVKNHD